MNHPACEGCYFNEQQGCADGRTQFDGCHVDPVKLAIEQRRHADDAAFDFFAANPTCQHVSVGNTLYPRGIK